MPILIAFLFESGALEKFSFGGVNTIALLVVIMFVYLFALSFYLVIIIRRVVLNSQTAKNHLIHSVEKKIKKQELMMSDNKGQINESLLKVLRLELKLQDIRKISTNPLDSNQCLKLIYATVLYIVIPIFVGVITR